MTAITLSAANYLFALTNVSWVKEVRSTTLTKEFMSKHGLKGSPKLSKQLLSLGLSHQQISNLLQLTTTATGGYKLWENGESPEVVVRLQGNSTHFSSCQRVTNPYDPDCWDGADRTNCKILEDKEAYEDGILSFITIGNPITEDNKGWTARAKLRHVINKNGETIAYYLDRFYGDGKKIEEAAMEIAAQRGVDLIGSTSYYSGKFAKEYVNCNIPSRWLGYQDSLDKYGDVYAVKLQSQSIILTAYRSREKDGGVYRTPVTKGVFNPQTNKMIESEIKPSRTIERALLKAFPNTDTSSYIGGVTKSGTHLKIHAVSNCVSYIALWRNCVSYMEVERSDPEKGYGKALSLPYYYNEETNTLMVSVDKDVKRPVLCYAAHEMVGVSGTKPCRDFDVWDSMVGGWAEACSIYEIDYETSEYNRFGFNREGYDRDGYDQLGYDEQGYDREGYNLYGYNYFGERL